MKPVLLAASIVSLIIVAACSRGEEAAWSGNVPDAASGSVPDAQTGNQVATPSGPITAEQAYDIRHERYEEMGDSLKAINRELKGDAPDIVRVQREAATLASLAAQIPSWFPVGSGPDVHTDSRAKAEIWSDAEGFREAHEGFRRQAESFSRVANDGDALQIRAAAQELQKGCGGCHEKYRGPER